MTGGRGWSCPAHPRVRGREDSGADWRGDQMTATAGLMRWVIVLLAAAGTCLSMSGLAQAYKMARIGVVSPPEASSPIEQGLRQRLRELGYIEGQNVLIEWRRSSDGPGATGGGAEGIQKPWRAAPAGDSAAGG